MHIAMLSGEYPPRWGGIGTVVHHLAGALADRGHEVSVITRDSRATKINPSLIPSQKGVEVIEVGWVPIPMAFTKSYGKRAMKELIKLHKKKPIDIVHLLCPLIAWKKKQFDFVKSEIAPVIAVMNGTWIGERDGLIFAAKNWVNRHCNFKCWGLLAGCNKCLFTQRTSKDIRSKLFWHT